LTQSGGAWIGQSVTTCSGKTLTFSLSCTAGAWGLAINQTGGGFCTVIGSSGPFTDTCDPVALSGSFQTGCCNLNTSYTITDT
jgi:hypothetical protein